MRPELVQRSRDGLPDVDTRIGSPGLQRDDGPRVALEALALDSIRVETALEVSGAGGTISVRGAGDRIRADVDRLATCLRLARFGSGRPRSRRVIRGLHAALESAGLTVEARWNSLGLARVGSGARRTFCSRLARIPEIELSALGLLVLLLAQLPGAWK